MPDDDAPCLLTSVCSKADRPGKPVFFDARACAFVGPKQHAREGYEEVTYCT